ncbi:MAG: response regulator [Alphaproteobacteria bacterium]
MTDIRQKLLDAFAAEHRDHLAAVRDMLQTAEDTRYQDGVVDLSEMHRRLHSLKGAARATDLNPLETLAHRLETLLSRIQQKIVPLDGKTAQVIHGGLDGVEDWFAAFVSGEKLPLFDDLLSQVDALSGASETVKRAPLDVPKPLPPSLENGTEEDGLATSEGRPTSVSESLRIDAGSLDRLLGCTREILMSGGQLADVRAETANLTGRFDRLERSLERLQTVLALEGQNGAGGSFADGLRALHDATIEARSLSRDFRKFAGHQREFTWRTHRMAKSLRNEVQQVRMVTADSVFGGLRKMVRDIASDEGKRVTFRMTGGETRADRIVLQDLKDPLIHMLRNAIGHGIELPAERLKAGKAETGQIHLDISTRGSRLDVCVTDDGQGLNLEAITAKARELGLLKNGLNSVDSYVDAQLLLNRAGFSTSESVTDLSGRGVGMSVVHRAALRLQGDVVMSAPPDGGLSVTVSVPVSIMTTKLLIVRAGKAELGLPAAAVERIRSVSFEELETVDGKPVFAPDGEEEAISVVTLDPLFGGEQHGLSDNERMTLVQINTGGSRIAVAVDEAVSVIDSIVEEVTPVLPDNELVSGTSTLGGDRVISVVNPSGLLAYFKHRKVDVHFAQVGTGAREKTPTVMVVDDSITTRTLEKSILEANGYRVRLSVDGLDALEQLRAEPADLVVSDVEMPRMDGFSLLRELKRDKVLAKTPVILVTSRDDSDDRSRGLSLGADAYVIKQRFDQTDLLDTIRQLL